MPEAARGISGSNSANVLTDEHKELVRETWKEAAIQSFTVPTVKVHLLSLRWAQSIQYLVFIEWALEFVLRDAFKMILLQTRAHRLVYTLL